MADPMSVVSETLRRDIQVKRSSAEQDRLDGLRSHWFALQSREHRGDRHVHVPPFMRQGQDEHDTPACRSQAQR